MKTSAIVSGTLALVAFGLCIGGGAVGLVWYSWPTPTPPPPVFATARVVEVPVEIPVEVEVVRTVEVMQVVTATPAPEQVMQLPALPDCADSAWIEMQPRSDLQAGALKTGTINRLNFVLVNTGTCTWEGYKLVSVGDPFAPIDVPYTQPGGQAIFSAPDFIVRKPLELRLYLQSTSGGLVDFENGNPLDGSIYYRMDTWSPISQAQSYDGSPGIYGCGPNG